jgi:hypothetical protein
VSPGIEAPVQLLRYLSLNGMEVAAEVILCSWSQNPTHSCNVGGLHDQVG